MPGITEPLMEAVLEEEIRRMDVYLSVLRPPSIDTLYIGGGTPSIVPPYLLGRFLERIFVRLPNTPKESTIEANPESLSIEFLDVIRGFPIDRLSAGIQTFQGSFFERFHRNSSPEINRAALTLVKEEWDRRFSIDLLYGIPGSTVQEALADLEEAVRYQPHHISLYQLTPEEDTRYGEAVQKGKVKPISSSREERMRRTLLRRAEELGFQRYEVSNLALPGYECRHNLRYWELRPYLGIGPSAVSTLPGMETGIVRLTEKANLKQYSEPHNIKNTTEWEEISAAVFMKEVFLMGLRTVRGLRRDFFQRIFGVTIEEVVPRSIQKYAPYIEQKDKISFTLTERGRSWLNRILLDLFDEIDQYPRLIHCNWPSD